jgi:hypothetical protein
MVSHGLFIRLFLMRYFRWNVEDLEKIKRFGICEICTLKKVDGGYTLDEPTKRLTESSSNKIDCFFFLMNYTLK